jgi:hypothetical protein
MAGPLMIPTITETESGVRLISIADDDDPLQLTEEECPGPADLESALHTETLNNFIAQAALVLDAGATLGEAISLW